MLQTLIYKFDSEKLKINVDGLNKRCSNICIYDSNELENHKKNSENSILIAIDSIEAIEISAGKNSLNEFQSFLNKKKQAWLFGYLSYEVKNEIEFLSSTNKDGLKFPMIHFFHPKFVIQIKDQIATVYYYDEYSSKEDAESVYEFSFSMDNKPKTVSQKATIKSKISKEEYIDTIKALKHQIQIGNIYEINFCQEFFAEDANVNLPLIYKNLNNLSKAPFSAFFKFDKHYLISSSPERFLKKTKNKILSQPIKGTIKRSNNSDEDALLKSSLRNNLKEQNENVMIVDIVRNDLSKIAKKGTVRVDELFEVYSFQQVHQLISSISCELKENITFTDIIRAAFPMGSMTGAPKISAMKLIDEYESTKRGLYSGTIGFMNPEGNFDFSVVIRSILYNEENKYLSFMTGSAITSKSEPEVEYEECLLKAKAMFEAIELSNK